MTHVDATVTRDGRWWLVKVPEYDIVGQAARLAEAEDVAREITALWLEIPEEDVSVTLTLALDKDIEETLYKASEEEQQARDLAAHAARMRGKAVRQLLDTGMAQVEAAQLLGISRQRVTQLVKASATDS
ncbi:hypothetical protein L1O03_02955 [Corynebacterium uropygiale]|uniref:Antitoxin HicB n=1 Tax=Corynebacterium uropygiale TaxID=1775911 RepID=A0A9X1QPN5_9CORY|nr:helix-turn-helix domain-containing protein [Corynebacterium uropygiale]MCF4006137.1 hypothetical protein [Corynebacterium uropygiale]